jgi:hypothetical protein
MGILNGLLRSCLMSASWGERMRPGDSGEQVPSGHHTESGGSRLPLTRTPFPLLIISVLKKWEDDLLNKINMMLCKQKI